MKERIQCINETLVLREGLNQFFLLLHHTGKASYGVQYCCRSYPVLAHLRLFLTRETAQHITNYMKQQVITHITLCFLHAHHLLHLCSTDCTGNLRETHSATPPLVYSEISHHLIYGLLSFPQAISNPETPNIYFKTPSATQGYI